MDKVLHHIISLEELEQHNSIGRLSDLEGSILEYDRFDITSDIEKLEDLFPESIFEYVDSGEGYIVLRQSDTEFYHVLISTDEHI